MDSSNLFSSSIKKPVAFMNTGFNMLLLLRKIPEMEKQDAVRMLFAGQDILIDTNN